MLGDDECTELGGLSVVGPVLGDRLDLVPVELGVPQTEVVALFPVFEVLLTTEAELVFHVLVEEDVLVDSSVHAVGKLILVRGHLVVQRDVVGRLCEVDALVSVQVGERNSLPHFDTGRSADGVFSGGARIRAHSYRWCEATWGRETSWRWEG